MLQEIKASWALLLGIGFIMVGNGLQGTLLGVRASLEGFEVLTTGAVSYTHLTLPTNREV